MAPSHERLGDDDDDDDDDSGDAAGGSDFSFEREKKKVKISETRFSQNSQTLTQVRGNGFLP